MYDQVVVGRQQLLPLDAIVNPLNVRKGRTVVSQTSGSYLRVDSLNMRAGAHVAEQSLHLCSAEIRADDVSDLRFPRIVEHKAAVFLY